MRVHPYERPWPVCCERYADLVQRRIGRRFVCRVCRKLFHRDPYVTYLKRQPHRTTSRHA